MNPQEFARTIENLHCTRLDCLFDDQSGTRKMERVTALGDIARILQQETQNIQFRWRYSSGEIHLTFDGSLYVCDEFLSGKQARAWAFYGQFNRREITPVTHKSLSFFGEEILRGTQALTGRPATS